MTPQPDRELQVLDAAARGLTVSQTGAELFLSADTVKTYRRRVLRRTGARNMAQAVAAWAEQRAQHDEEHVTRAGGGGRGATALGLRQMRQ